MPKLSPDDSPINAEPADGADTNVTHLNRDRPEDLAEPSAPIPKPSGFSLDKFKTKHADAIANVETLQGALPHYGVSSVKDFVRLHPDEAEYWSPELCFVEVPIKGQKNDTLHLIEEGLALRWLDSGKVKRFRLALASKPHDVFFLAHVPTRNLDNGYNQSNLAGCELAKSQWVSLISRKGEGVDAYKITVARDPDAFPTPNWPAQTLAELIEKTFAGHMIDHDEHPALLRLLGAKQSTS
jgi:hypothetical protein